MSASTFRLVKPHADYLPGYVAALKQGWSPDTQRPEAALEKLEQIAADPLAFIAEQWDPEGKGPLIVLPDGTRIPRLPGYNKWMWDGEFCGNVNFRWQPGTTDLPPTCLGHIGYSVVPWKRRQGFATRALALLLADARALGMAFVDLTADADNVPSRRVIEANGGVLVEEFLKSESHGGAPGVRYRIMLQPEH